MSSQDGIRVTTADAYLSHGSMLRNLTIRSDAQVSDIVFTGARATGVHLLDGTLVEASWVVVCAGTYGSPLILMRSGIGPAGYLRSIGLPVRIDLPGVGENLADHPAAYVDFGYDGASRAAPILHSIVTFHSREASAGGPPDLMLWLSDPVGTPAEFGIEVVLLKPQSRGTVRLRSANPLDPPVIGLPNFRERVDPDRLVDCDAAGSPPPVWRLCTPGDGRRPGARASHLRGPVFLTARGGDVRHGFLPGGRHGAADGRRRIDHANRAVGIHPHSVDHARGAPRRATRRPPLTRDAEHCDRL